ncbi:hypothetical protein EVAR_52770_1 [Eumeta japonica]|uniref:Uncharacterized protein n=1 Tax=Eumeta variegata TaxID=151549 RepID=A0A4C1XBK5_EUMVA|nr:hypothetical protein EVAR_52770_1 [Eumeta japonica]
MLSPWSRIAMVTAAVSNRRPAPGQPFNLEQKDCGRVRFSTSPRRPLAADGGRPRASAWAMRVRETDCENAIVARSRLAASGRVEVDSCRSCVKRLTLPWRVYDSTVALNVQRSWGGGIERDRARVKAWYSNACAPVTGQRER